MTWLLPSLPETYSGPKRSATKAAISSRVICPDASTRWAFIARSVGASNSKAMPSGSRKFRWCPHLRVLDGYVADAMLLKATLPCLEFHSRGGYESQVVQPCVELGEGSTMGWHDVGALRRRRRDRSTGVPGRACRPCRRTRYLRDRRTQLMYGARLRRSGQRVKAREQLRTAHEAFEEMDLTAWVLHAADELAATGAKPRACRPQATEPLTSQETRVALHAAKGMSNKDRGPFPQPEDRRASSEQCLPEARFPFPRGIGRIIPYARGRLTGAASRASGCWIPAGGSRLGEGSAIDRAPRQRWRTRTRSH
jgi:hypothetical protein